MKKDSKFRISKLLLLFNPLFYILTRSKLLSDLFEAGSHSKLIAEDFLFFKSLMMGEEIVA